MVNTACCILLIMALSRLLYGKYLACQFSHAALFLLTVDFEMKHFPQSVRKKQAYAFS
jgi:hypothetical protein